jgi:hypothetical protein
MALRFPEFAFMCVTCVSANAADAAQVSAQTSLDSHIQEFRKAVHAKDAAGTVDSLVGGAIRLNKLVTDVTDAVTPLADAVEIVSRATAAFNQEPMELDSLVESITKDTAALEAVVVPSAPKVGNLMEGIPEKELQSTDPRIRGSALDKLRTKGRQFEEGYRQELGRLKVKRDKAREVYEEARAADERGYELEKVLDKLNSSPAGAFLNIGGGRLVWMLVETGLYVRPALTRRENAARDLVGRYDNVIQQMETTLQRYALYDDWASFYRVQDWVHENTTAAAAMGGLDPSENLAKAEEKFAEAGQLTQSLGVGQSRNAAIMQQLAEETVRETGATMEAAKKLLDAASRKADRASALREFTGLINLAGAVAGVSAAKAPQPAQSPPQISIRQKIEFKLVVPAPPSVPAPSIQQPRLP